MLDSSVLPPSGGAVLRNVLGLDANAPLRVSYLHGPGDCEGTFEHWLEGRHDPRVPSLTYSGQFYDLMESLGAEAQIIGTFHRSAPPPRSGPFRFERVEEPPLSGPAAYWRSEIRRGRAYRRLLDSFNPHITVVSSDLPAMLWPLLGRRRLIGAIHNTFWPMGRPPRSKKARLSLAAAGFGLRRLAGAACTSPECARQLTALTRRPISIHVEFPQIVERYPVRERSRAASILFLGRIEVDKGVFLLLDAFAEVAQEQRDVSLAFAGSGSAEAALRAAVAARPETPVRVLGRLDAGKVHSTLEEVDLLVCPTLSAFNEGLALVCLEAVAHGVPSLVSSVVPALDHLEDACMVFEADDGAALTQSLKTLIEDDSAYRRLHRATAARRETLYDRSRSFGAALWRAMAGEPTPR